MTEHSALTLFSVIEVAHWARMGSVVGARCRPFSRGPVLASRTMEVAP